MSPCKPGAARLARVQSSAEQVSCPASKACAGIPPVEPLSVSQALLLTAAHRAALRPLQCASESQPSWSSRQDGLNSGSLGVVKGLLLPLHQPACRVLAVQSAGSGGEAGQLLTDGGQGASQLSRNRRQCVRPLEWGRKAGWPEDWCTSLPDRSPKVSQPARPDPAHRDSLVSLLRTPAWVELGFSVARATILPGGTSLRPPLRRRAVQHAWQPLCP